MPAVFWSHHLEHSGFETGLFQKLQTFFEKKLLFWLEALSLTNNVGLALPACSALTMCLLADQGVSMIQLLIWRVTQTDTHNDNRPLK